jgi:hypothetical protein
MKLIKGILLTSFILLGCFEILQLFNKLDALNAGKRFLKTHNATVDSIDCYVPARVALDRSAKICAFKASSKQIQTLVKNIGFRPISSILSDEEMDGVRKKFNHKAETNGVVEATARIKLYDWRQTLSIETHTCWATLSLKNRSELELYGRSEEEESKFRHNFFIFYKQSNATGCFVFSPYLESEPGMYGSN